MVENFSEKVNLIWSIAELLRGPYRPNQYKDVMLPLIVLRRLDSILEPTKKEVLKKYTTLQEAGKIQGLGYEPILNRISGVEFHNISRFTFKELIEDHDHIAENLTQYIKGFSSKARDILENFEFEKQIDALNKADRLYLIVKSFTDSKINLHPDYVSNIEMGYIFEELIRKFNEASNEEAGDHFTPREVIQLMVNLLFITDNDVLTTKGIIKSLFDPACGTGGMLSVSEEYLHRLNPDATLQVFGQDYNPQAYAICGSDMMIKGQSLENIYCGNSFTDDHFPGKKFDYLLANPPFGVEWKPEEKVVTREFEELGFAGRFGAGLPPINDGALLFLQHMISKMKPPEEGGTRLSIVFNGSPLFTGSAGSGPSEIRRWIIEHDWLEAIVALPDQLFYNTGISTYLFVVTNRKAPGRKGKIQLVDGRTFFKKMRKSLGNKRFEICEVQRDDITRLYGDYTDNEFVKIFDNEDFGYRRITVERPLRLNFAVTDERLSRLTESKTFIGLASSKKQKDTVVIEEEIAVGRRTQEKILSALNTLRDMGIVQDREKFTSLVKNACTKNQVVLSAQVLKAVLSALSERDETAPICTDSKGNPEPDSDLRDYENVPLKMDVSEYMEREVLPHVPDAWVDESKSKIGYEINFNRYFYKYTPPRPLEEIEADLKVIEAEILELLARGDQ
jgi:type I restriction enzyme M protein